MKLKQFIQQETVLTAAAVLAVVSAFFVPPDVQYLGYIDLRTLAILFSPKPQRSSGILNPPTQP